MGLIRFANKEVPMLGWFHALMPQEQKFFDMFARHSDVVLAGAEEIGRAHV